MFVVDRTFFLHIKSATSPAMTMKIHINKYGAPDNIPFYNISMPAIPQL